MSKKIDHANQKRLPNANQLKEIRLAQKDDNIQKRCLAAIDIIKAFLYTAGLCYIIHELSGKNTFAFLSFETITSKSYAWVWGWLFGFICLGYGKRQKKLKEQNVSRMGSYNKKLEEALDKNRTSSELDIFGNTKEK